jgi:hypothetical protein
VGTQASSTRTSSRPADPRIGLFIVGLPEVRAASSSVGSTQRSLRVRVVGYIVGPKQGTMVLRVSCRDSEGGLTVLNRTARVARSGWFARWITVPQPARCAVRSTYAGGTLPGVQKIKRFAT